MGIYLDTNSKFYDWCEENGYDEEEYDLDESVYKRGSSVFFYIKKLDGETYASVSAYQSYDNGREEITIEKEGLKRTEKQITTTTVVYE